MRKVLFLVLLAPLYVAACGDEFYKIDYTKIENKRTPLVLGLVSYMSFEEVIQALDIDDSEYVVIEDSKEPEKGNTPQFDNLDIEITEAKIGTFSGTVQLHWFNDRLMEARFYPEDLEGFVRTIEDLGFSTDAAVKPYTNIWLYEDYRNMTYIGWADTRLERQMAEWIENYT